MCLPLSRAADGVVSKTSLIGKSYIQRSSLQRLVLFCFFSLRPFLSRNFFQEILGLEGSKISWGKKKGNVSYEEIFPQNFLAQNFLRKKKLEFSQPRKFSSPKFPGDKRKFYEEILRSLHNRTEISTRGVPLPSTG